MELNAIIHGPPEVVPLLRSAPCVHSKAPSSIIVAIPSSIAASLISFGVRTVHDECLDIVFYVENLMNRDPARYPVCCIHRNFPVHKIHVFVQTPG